MEFILNMLYRDIMPFAPKASRCKTPDVKDKYSHGWVFLANKDTLNAPVSCRSLTTLFKLAKENTYITPNGFAHNRFRNKMKLRWLNAFVLDYDDLLDPEEVLFRITRSGLPAPTFLNQTNSGIHAWWVFEKPERAGSRKTISLYDGIHQDMVYAADADKHFVRASASFVRVPKHIIWQSGTLERYTLETFKEWREINIDHSSRSLAVNLYNKGAWLSSPGIQALLQMDVPDGQRGNACFTLALAFKADGYDAESAFAGLCDWNAALSAPITEKRIWNTVSSVYRNSYHQPSRADLALFVGKELAYAKVRYITPAKPRSERLQWHLKEISELIIQDLEKNKLVEESQSDWAQRLNIPLRSFKKVLSELREQGIVFGICGRGRYATSYYKLSETYINHGPAAFLSDCDEISEKHKKVKMIPESTGEAVDNSTSEGNGAYPYIRVVSGLEGGSPRSLPAYLSSALRSLLLTFSLFSGHVLSDPILWDTG